MKTFAVWLALVAPAMGQPRSWEKAPEQWSDADAKRILTESPWARPTRLLINKSSQPRNAPQGSSLPTQSLRVTVRFEGASPVRLALQKVGLVPVGVLDASECTVVVEFPARWAQYRVAAGDWHDAQAWIEPAGAPRIEASRVRLIEETDNVAALVFAIKRTPELTSARYARLPIFLKRDVKTIKFGGRVGTLTWKQSFSVPAMVYQGRLEL
jgi:hypothetical protein